MSYSARDITEAFECAGGDGVSPGVNMRMRVFAHLDGRCECDLRRCKSCGARPRNSITSHKPTCALGGKA